MTRAPKSPKRIAIAGASGFIGSALTRHLEGLGHAVLRIGRHEDPKHGNIKWDPDAGTMDVGALAGVRIVVNLTGATIGRRWTLIAARRSSRAVCARPRCWPGPAPRWIRGRGRS